jgi:hypothetical protein
VRLPMVRARWIGGRRYPAAKASRQRVRRMRRTALACRCLVKGIDIPTDAEGGRGSTCPAAHDGHAPTPGGAKYGGGGGGRWAGEAGQLRRRRDAHILWVAVVAGTAAVCWGWIGEAGAFRFGEASHPGPDPVGQDGAHDGPWEVHGCARFRRPHQEGFHRALMDVDGQLDDGGDVGEFALMVDTCNSTSWGGAMRYLRRTRAHLVLLQEHHLPPDRVAGASAWALKNGWHSLFLPAEPGVGRGWRAGVAVLARPHVGLSAPVSGPIEITPSRIIAASIEPPGFRRCTVVSAYLEDGRGMGPVNLRHMESIGACIGAQGEHVPCIVGGDWQAPPEVVANTGFASQANVSLVASLDPRGTFRDVRKSSELDYFFPDQ